MHKLNLQFFAEGDDVAVGTGVEVSEAAAPMGAEGNIGITSNEGIEGAVGTVTEQGDPNVNVTQAENVEPAPNPNPNPISTIDTNAIAASIRRKLEKEARAEQERRDAEYARRFGNYTNPRTGQPIRSERDYFDALDAQEVANTGVDPALIDKFVNNDPRIRQAEEVMENARKQEALNQINADVLEISKLDPTITKYDDVPNEVVNFALENHFSLVNAYKILNYGKVSSKNAEAIRQNAVNQIMGKQHMAPMNGVATNNAEIEIPLGERAIWEASFPNKSYAELRTLYNKQLG